MHATSVNRNTTGQAQFRTHPVRTGSGLTGFFIGDCQMRTIKLTQGQVALVDEEDFEELSKHKWYALKRAEGKFAAARNVLGKVVYMSRVIVSAVKGMCGDHQNHQTLDNRRANLRLATVSQNQQNRKKQFSICSSKYKGVDWHKRDKKWRARIKFNGKKMSLGHFNSETEAAITYDKKAKELFGEFACLNFPKNEADYAHH